MKWGWNAGFGAGQNREINYNTINDKQVFLKDDDYIRSFIRGNVELTYRKAIKTRHTLGIAYGIEEVRDTVMKLNPSYFKTGHNRIYSPAIYYNLSYYDLDYIPYPTRGYAAQRSISKTGLNKLHNLWQLHMKLLGSWPITKKTFFSANAYAGIKLPFHQPYFNRRFLGYDASMQGFEYYVIDGVAGGYLKSTLATNFLNFNIKLPQRKNNRGAEHIPFRFYGKIFGNGGYVHDPEPGENTLSNQMLYSGGIGIDIVTLYDVTFKFEWTFNHLGQNGLFLHRKTTF
jgi:outer membrane protein assembly factor BamA